MPKIGIEPQLKIHKAKQGTRYILLIGGITLLSLGWWLNSNLIKGAGIYQAVKFGNIFWVKFYIFLRPSFVDVHYDFDEPMRYVPTKERTGDTLLHLATEARNLEIMRFLIREGSSVNALGHLNRTPLHYAAGGRSGKEAVELLIQSSANVSADDSYGNTPLHFAVNFSENLEVVELLIRSGANLNAKNYFGKTPLDNAEGKQLIQLLQNHGAKSGDYL